MTIKKQGERSSFPCFLMKIHDKMRKKIHGIMVV
jgi:hypothetical protein